MARPRKTPPPDGAAPSAPPAAAPEKVTVKGKKPQVAAGKPPQAPAKPPTAAAPDPMHEPEFRGQDHYVRPQPVKIALRAGVDTYHEELQERLKDLEDNNTRVIYEIPLKVSGDVYAMLLKDAIRHAKKNPNWTERDHLEMLIRIRDAGVLIPSGKKA